MSQLRIYLAQDWRDEASVCDWALLDDANTVLRSGTDTLLSMPAADECVAIVGAAQVLCIAKSLPKIKINQLEKALPLALEDCMLGDAGEQHVVPGEVTSEGKTVLYAMDKTRLRQFVQACAATSMRLRRVVPEYCLLAVAPDEWSLLWDANNAWLARSHRQGCVLGQLDTMQVPVALNLLWQAGAPTALRIFNAPALPQWPGMPLLGADTPFDWRSAPLLNDMPNLLWGKLAPPLRIREWWPKLRPVFWILLIALCIEALGYNLQWISLAREKQQLKQSMNSVFQETFGSEVEVMDAPLQLQRSLTRARHAAGVADDADFLPLLERLSGELAAQGGSQVLGLRYTEGQLDVELRLPQRAALDAVLQSLSEQGLRAHTLDVKDSAGQIEAQLRIALGGAR